MLDKLLITEPIQSDDYWSTTNEKGVIDGLGRDYAPTFIAFLGINTPIKKIQYRLRVLKGYESGLYLRQRWGKIDQVVIRNYIATAIEKTKAELSALSAESP